jgi:hypothetical protein
MAGGAGLRKADLRVVGIVGGGVILGVAAHTVGGRALEASPGVTGLAVQLRVRAGEREAGEARMIELGAQPGVHAGVAHLAVGGELQRHVGGVGGLLVGSQVAAGALGRQALELAGGRALVAVIALQDGVRAQQGEAVLVLLDLLRRDLPALHRVAMVALRSHLAPMDVGMAVRAFVAHVGEHQAGVALGAAYPLMHPPQGVAGLVVVELGNAADGLPAGGGVAVLARDVEVAVRAAGVHVGRLPGRSPGEGQQQPQHDDLQRRRRQQELTPGKVDSLVRLI